MISLPQLVANVARKTGLSSGNILDDDWLMGCFVEHLNAEGYDCHLVERDVVLLQPKTTGLRRRKSLATEILAIRSGGLVFNLTGQVGWDEMLNHFTQSPGAKFSGFYWEDDEEKADFLSWHTDMPAGLIDAIRLECAFARRSDLCDNLQADAGLRRLPDIKRKI